MGKYELVRELLLQKGVDLTHERYLILQGEVESISRMKPKAETPTEVGLLEYLEEHIGAWRKEIELTEYLNKFEEMVNKKTELDKRRAEVQAEMTKLLVQFQGQKKAFEKAKEATLTK